MASVSDYLNSALGNLVQVVPSTPTAAPVDSYSNPGGLTDYAAFNQYGPAASDIIRARVNAAANQPTQLQQTANVIEDAADDAVTGLSALPGIVGLGLGTAGNALGSPTLQRLGVGTATATQKFNDYIQAHQSPEMQAARAKYQADTQSDFDANQRQYEQDKSNYGTLVAGLKRIGSDAITSLSATVDNPRQFGSLSANAVGSLVTAGPMSKGLEAVGATFLKGASKVGLAESSVASTLIRKGIEDAAVPASIGLQEGGGTYQQTAAQAMDMLSNRTDLTDDQKVQLANQAATEAGLTQAPLAAIVGKLTEKFEAEPFHVGSVRSAIQNAGKEALEEGIQSGTSQVLQNKGIQDFVDPNQDLTDGVGAQIAQGAIGGLGSAGITQTPGLIGSAVNSTVDAAHHAISQGIDKVASTADRAAGIVAPVVQTAKSIGSALVSPLYDRILAAADKVTAQNEADQAAVMENHPVQPEAPVEAPQAAPVAQESDNQDSLLVPHQDAEPLPETAPAPPEQAVEPTSQTEASAPTPALVKPENIQPVTEKSVQTSEGQQNVQNAIDIAQSQPSKVNPEINDQILFQHSNGKITLSPAQIAALQSSNALVRAQQTYDQSMQTQGMKPADYVAQEISYGTDNGSKGPSVVQHVQGIMDAYRSGDTQLAAARLYKFGQFAQHMQNKVQAFNEHFQSGNDASQANHVKYESLTPQGKWLPSVKGLFVNPTAAGSIQQAQRVDNEARVVSSVYNQMTDALPFLNGTKVAPVALNPILNGNAQEVATKFKSGELTRSSKVNEASNNVEQPSSEPIQEESNSSPEAPEAQNVGEETGSEHPVSENPADGSSDGTSGSERPTAEERPEAQANPEEKAASTDAGSEGTSVTEPSDAGTAPRSLKETVKKGVAAVYEKLASPNLAKTFRVPASNKSRILGSGNPIEVITDTLSSATKARNFIGSELYGYTPEIARAYTKQILPMAQSLSQEMEDNLQRFLESKKITSEMIAEGKALTWQNGKPLNLIEEDGKGGYTYNQELLQSAVLAGMQWLLTGNQNSSTLDADEAAERYNVDVEDVMQSVGKTPKGFPITALDVLNKGLTLEEAKNSLTAKINSFWGLSPNDSAPINLVQGIPMSMAAEFMEALQNMGTLGTGENAKPVLGVETVKLGEKTVDVYIPYDFGKEHPTKKFPDAIERAVVAQPELTHYIDQVPETVAETQLRNPTVKNTPNQSKTLTFEQGVKHYVNQPIVDFYRAIGLDGLLDIFGSGKLDPSQFNKVDYASKQGKNVTITSAFNTLMDLMTEVDHIAEAKGVESNELPIYLRYAFNRLNRMQALGKDNPQSSKLVREAYLPTWATVDLSDSKAFNAMHLALAQALGEKVHTQSLETSVQNAQNLLNGQFREAVDILRDWQNDKHLFTDEERASLKSAGIESFAGLHALMEYARYLNASQEERQKFRTALYVEADGITNGPVNAMGLFSHGNFNQDWLDNIRRGGFFPGQEGQSMNDYRTNTPGAKDLYQSATDAFRAALKEQRGAMSDIQLEMSNRLLGLMDLFYGKDLSFDPESGELTLTRGIAKNPLTISIYGSGANGIAGKMVDTMMTAVYSRLSQVVQAGPDVDVAKAMFGDQPMAEEQLARFVENFRVLTQATLNKEGELRRTKVQERKFIPQTFELTKEEYKALRKNMLDLFVGPLREGIAATVGSNLIGEDSSTDTVRKATQAMSIYYQYAFQREINALREGKDKGWFPSQNDLNKIQEKLAHIAPFISNGEQNLLIAKQAKALQSQQFGNSLFDHYRTDGEVYGPADAGVSGTPMLTISYGDGAMMQFISTMKGALQNTLKIFDGMHLSLNDLQEGSRQANEAVAQSWQQNPLMDVSKKFSAFLKAAPEEMSKEQVQALTRALFDPAVWEKGATPSQIREELSFLDQHLSGMAQSAQARHNAIERISYSIDQMAGVGSPFSNTGETNLSGASDEEILNELNRLYGEELGKLATGKDSRAPSDDISNELANVGRSTVSGARELSFTATKNLIRSISLTTEQRGVLGDVIRSLATKGYKVVFGNIDQLRSYSEQKGLPFVEPAEGSFSGSTDIGSKTIWMVKPSAETLVHEMIHAATFEKVSDHYEGNAGVDPAIAGAVDRMESLRDQFMSVTNDLRQFSNEVRQSAQSARIAIQSYLNVGNRAAALNEFMAWGLSNQNLIELQKNQTASPIATLARNVIDALKTLIFGRKKVTKPQEDMFSNLRWNTNIILRSEPTVQSQENSTTLYQNETYGNDQRISDMRDQFGKIISSQMNQTAVDRQFKNVKLRAELTNAVEMTKVFNAAGFNMSQQERGLFQRIVLALATEAHLDPNALGHIQSFYSIAEKALKVEDFMSDPESIDPNERALAQSKYDAIMGRSGMTTDTQGRSSLLPTFLALSMVNDEFRSILQKMEIPNAEKDTSGTLDAFLGNLGDGLMQKLGDRMAGLNKPSNITEALDQLTNRILETAQDDESFISQVGSTTMKGLGVVNDTMVSLMGRASDALIEKAKDLNENSESKTVATAAGIMRIVASMISEKNSEIVAEGTLKMLNRMKLNIDFKELAGDLVGRTQATAPIFDMIKLVRSTVSQIRQQFRENLPSVINSKFSRPLTDDEQTAMHTLARTDIMSLRSGFSNEEILQLLQDNSLAAGHINDLEEKLKASYGKNWNLLHQKSKELADYMINRKVPSNLLRNANAVANLYNSGAGDVKVTPDSIRNVDHLVSLYALQLMQESHTGLVSDLAKSEVEGTQFALAYLLGQRNEEVRKTEGITKNNALKGFIPSEQKAGLNLIVADDSEFARLSELSFKRLGNYDGSTAEQGRSSKGYYYATVSGRSPFMQGIFQNVRNSAGGVDGTNGSSLGLNAGRISDPQTVANITQRLGRESGSEPLIPIFNSGGKIVAYERSIDPKYLGHLEQNTNFSKMIGVWRGRQAEENLAQQVNEALIENLKDMYDSEKQKTNFSDSEYTDILSQQKDPVLADAVKLLTQESRDYIQQIWGDKFMVRNDLLKDVFGYRAASVGDMWTGNSRWSPEMQRIAKGAALRMFGNEAYAKFVNAEKLVQNLVHDSKVAIVVKSVVVPYANMIGNVLQLAARGVPVWNTVGQFPKKIAETEQYVQSKVRLIAAEAELRAASDDPHKTLVLKREIRSIEDSHRRMSIWPLIQAGEFSAVSDGDLDMEDVSLFSGKLNAYIENKVNQLPGSLKTAGRYALVAHDTPLFKGLQKAVEYGDFIAKATLFDHLKKKGLTNAQALAQVTEEFINYDRNSGRTRQYLESMGLGWFWNYKIRSAKIALSMIRNNPVHALLASVAPIPAFMGNVGLPLGDNIFSQALDGKLFWSMGPREIWRGIVMNPWINMVS